MRVTPEQLHHLDILGLEPVVRDGRLRCTHHYAADGDQWTERESVLLSQSRETAAQWIREYTMPSTGV